MRILPAIMILIGTFSFSHTQSELNIINDFQSMTTQGWKVGSPSPLPPSVVIGGGPEGVGDHFLRTRSNGTGGAGGRWIIFTNHSDWRGDWTAANIEYIRMGIKTHNEPIHLRIAVEGDGGRFCTRQAVMVADTNWQEISLSVLPDSMESVGGNDLMATLSSVHTVRILSNEIPEWKGEVISRVVDIDNISTGAIQTNNRQFNSQPALHIFPNPAHDRIYLDFRMARAGDNPIYIFNTMGQVIYHQANHLQLNQLDISSWTNGRYFVQVGEQHSSFIKVNFE